MVKRWGKKPKYKSKWEALVAEELKKLNLLVLYEKDTLEYTIPEKVHKYRPDWKLRPKRYIESKGIFDAKDRQKMLLIKEQHPDVKVYMLFQNAYQKLYKGGKTTYGEWCTKNGIEWSHKIIKKEWLKDKNT